MVKAEYIIEMQRRLDASLDADRAGVPIDVSETMIWITYPVRVSTSLERKEGES